MCHSNPQSAIRNRLHSPLLPCSPAPLLPCVSIRNFLVLLTALSLCGCAGWRVGNSTLYRPDIRTVYVPPVDSASFRRNLGERLTEAIVRELESKSSYKVVADPNADSILRCALITDSKSVISETRFDDPRDIDLNFFIQVSWTDRRGDLIHGQPSNVPLPTIVMNDKENLGESANFVPEGGQSLATAQQEAFQKIAQQIVGMMESPW